jgi:hypothetical protein
MKKLELHRILYKSFIEIGIDEDKAGKLSNLLSNELYLDKTSLLKELSMVADGLLKTKSKLIAGTT